METTLPLDPAPRTRVRVQTTFSGKSRTEQHHRNETNINRIMARFNKTGLLPGRGAAGFYGDFTNVADYHDACDRILQAKENFMALPSDLRKHFHNDPAELLAFLSDENNLDKAVELGIIPPIEKDIEPETPVSNEEPENPE